MEADECEQLKRVSPLAHRTRGVTEQKGARMDSRTVNSTKIHFVEIYPEPRKTYGISSLSTELLFNAFFRSYKYFAVRLEKPAESLVALHEKRMASTPPPLKSYAPRGLD